jgi:hypothetical protein
MFKLLWIPLLFWIYPTSAQTLSSFFYQEGNALMATLAHPTNTYRYAKYEVRNNEVWVDIYYEGYNTELKIKRSGNFFNPFSAINILKEMVWDFIRDSSDQRRKDEWKGTCLPHLVSGLDGLLIVLRIQL